MLHISRLTVQVFQTTAFFTTLIRHKQSPNTSSHAHSERVHTDSPVALPSVPYIRVWYGVFVCLLIQEVKHVLDGERQGTSSVRRAEDGLEQVIHELLERTLSRRANTGLVGLQNPSWFMLKHLTMTEATFWVTVREMQLKHQYWLMWAYRCKQGFVEKNIKVQVKSSVHLHEYKSTEHCWVITKLNNSISLHIPFSWWRSDCRRWLFENDSALLFTPTFWEFVMVLSAQRSVQYLGWGPMRVQLKAVLQCF